MTGPRRLMNSRELDEEMESFNHMEEQFPQKSPRWLPIWTIPVTLISSFLILVMIRPLPWFAGHNYGPKEAVQRWSKQANHSNERPSTPSCVHCNPCEDQNECLGIVDSFFRSAPKGSLGLYRTYERALDGGDCPQCDLSKDFDALKKRCDVYDNAVAAIYLTKRGQVEAAQEILDVFLRLMYPTDFTNIYPEELYRGLPSGRTLTLLAAAYECDTVVKAGTYDEPQVMDGAVDSGNNAWVAIAFAHFAAATGKGCYRAAAEDILRAISISGSCADDLDGFLARLPPARGNHRSLEHNIDIFALAGMLREWPLQERAQRFVESMYGKNQDYPQAYNVGTVGSQRCGPINSKEDGIPADGQFWNLLASVEPDADRVGKSVSWLIFSDAMWEYDKDFLSQVDPAPILHGVRFTSKGFGIQWEETAGAVIALSHFLAYRSSGSEEEFKDRLRQRLEASRLSLRTLLKMYGAVPASVRGGNGDAYNAHNAYAPYPGGSDTGMGFSYLRMIHVASTAWSGLALLGATLEGDPIWKGANPMKMSETETLPSGDTWCLPQQELPPSAISDRACLWK